MDASLDQAVYSQYYRRIFPFGLLYKWLSYGSASYFSRREFSNTITDDIYHRYLSYDTVEEFRSDVIAQNPTKIDIGAVYSSKPRDHRIISSSNYEAVERELVFDIDLTDYDDVRFCCAETRICKKCWSLVSLAILLVDLALEEDFGFKHRFWVYSGRRGAHCWVCDEAARRLAPSARHAIAEYLTVVKGGEHRSKKVYLSYPLHHSLARSKAHLVEFFYSVYLSYQEGFLGERGLPTLFAIINNEDCQREIREMLQQQDRKRTTLDKWNQVHAIIARHRPERAETLITEIMFQHCYPRLDVNVTKGMSHLLKSPFCVHPKTGYICVPINVKALGEFDPFQVPTVSKLLEECDTFDRSEAASHCKGMRDYEKTSLRQGVAHFERFLENLQLDSPQPKL